MRTALFLAALLALAAPVAHAQPDGRGVYAVAGTAAPERALFRDPADPRLVVGYRLSPSVDVQVGARLDQSTIATSVWGERPRDRPLVDGEPVTTERRDESAAAAGSVGLRVPLGPFEVRSRGSVALDRLERSVFVERYVADAPSLRADVEARAATFLHAGISGALAVPVERGGGRIAPGLGLAVSTSGRLRGDLTASGVRWMAFASVPTSVPVGPTVVTLDATAGAVFDGPGTGRPADVVLEAGLRVDL